MDADLKKIKNQRKRKRGDHMARINIVIDKTSNLMEVLPEQERKICELLINGHSNVKIATALNMSEDIVNNTMMDIYKRIGFSLEKILTKRQREICDLIIAGCSDEKIAEALIRVSPKTPDKNGGGITKGAVRIHVSNIFRIIGVHSRSDLIVCYRNLKEAAIVMTVFIPQLLPTKSAKAKLRLEGEGTLPNVIPIVFGEKQVFTIGRHDASVGVKQRDFEFVDSQDTSSISRFHAVIEQLPCGGYAIKDKSRYGTIVNGEKLVRDVPRRINHGDRVTIAHTQNNYIFEECDECDNLAEVNG